MSATPSRELIVADLLAAPLSDFTDRRNTKAKELKLTGKAELAAEIAALKKPPVAVWAVNQLRRNKELLERLRRAGVAVVNAQQGAVGGRGNAAKELRSASDGLQRELDGAVRAAADTLRTSGHSADEATLRRMQEIFRLAAVTGGETWDQLRAGVLIDEPRAGEDMLTAAFAVGAGSPGKSGPPPTKETGRGAERAAANQAAEMEKRMALEHAQRVAKLDEEEAQQANQTARRLREEAERVAADAKRANEKAKQAEKEHERAAAKAKASREAARRLGDRT